MPNAIYFDPTAVAPIVWADFAGDFGDSIVASLEKQITLASLASGASREGAKADMFVNSHLPQRWAVTVRIEMDIAVVDSEVVPIYWAASPHATVGTLNPYLITGADAVVAETAGMLGQLQYIGAVPLTVAIAPNIHQATFVTTIPHRYGAPLVFNNTTQAFEGDDVEMFVAFYPMIDEMQ